MDDVQNHRYVTWRKEAERRCRLAVEPPVASRLPATIDVAAIRHRLSLQFGRAPLSQGAFAKRFGFSAAAVVDWEQGRRRPDAAARVLLLMIRDHAHTVDAMIQAVIDQGQPPAPVEVPE